MTRERWEQIEQIYHEAIQQVPANRAAFVAERCAGDDALLQEVESLVAANAQTGVFLDTPAMQVAASALSRAAMGAEAGQMLGSYQLFVPLGAGGMGEVWKAHDSRVDRDVAIKFCKWQFTDHFEREARSIAALNHPNICQLYDIGPNYLVMELVEGPALADRLRQGPIPLREALGIARQIAEALEAAHERGRVHRDLKPGNIKINPDGLVKLLDFGLATTAEESVGTDDKDHTRSLMTSPMRAGAIVGTPAYMSPEHARGSPVDKRTDIWAFGAVLYEMLTGKPAFAGETANQILEAVSGTEPDWSALPGSTPARIRRLLRRCLERDRKQRLQDIGEARRPCAARGRSREEKSQLADESPRVSLGRTTS